MNFDPTDRELERAGQRLSEMDEATARARELFTYEELLELVQTYSDRDAADKLDNLRGRFWTDTTLEELQNKLIASYREDDE